MRWIDPLVDEEEDDEEEEKEETFQKHFLPLLWVAVNTH